MLEYWKREVLILVSASLELDNRIVKSLGQQAGGLKPACRQGQIVPWLTWVFKYQLWPSPWVSLP